MSPIEKICIDELRRNIRKSVLHLSAYLRFSLHSLNNDMIRGVTGISINTDITTIGKNKLDIIILLNHINKIKV